MLNRLRTISALLFLLFFLAALSSVASAQSRRSGRASRVPQRSKIRFEDIARRAGLGNSTLHCGGPQKKYLVEALCGGVAFLDYDNDGWEDILLVGGSTLAAVKDPAHADCPQFQTRLYHNNHNGTFTDVTARSGLNPRPCRWGFGVAVGDYDNDGYD